MDYLRRLAPARAADPSRALAVPSPRFGDLNPLSSPSAQAGSRPLGGEDDAPLDAIASPAAPMPAAFQTSSSRSRDALAPGPLTTVELSGDGVAFGSTPTHELDSRYVDSSATPVRELQLQNSTNGAASVPPGIAALAAPRGYPLSVAPANQHANSPLSHAVLAQRIPLAREENQVVHVTIGRIDVVANPAPASPPKRGPEARQGSVALADYLRGGSRR